MTNTPSPQDLGERIERLVEEYISATRVCAQAAMDRAFGSATKEQRRAPVGAQRPSRRRGAAEVAALGERLYAAVCRAPGETMMVLAPAVGGSPRELHRPMAWLKSAGRVRSIGTRQGTRYFPIAGESERSP